MNSLLQKYYQGITQQLRSEVDFINSLFQHQGVKGEGNESVLRDLIVKFIPKRYGVGTGVVVDQQGNPSCQCDIIVYDTFLYPSLLSLTHSHLFPVDIVYATIEVKTTLESKSAKEALQNIASVRRLDYIQHEFGATSIQENEYAVGIYRSTPPIGIIFAYNSDVIQDETFKNWFIPTNDKDTPLYPSIVACLDMGIISFAPQNITENGSAVSLQPEVGMQSSCMTFPVARQKEDAIGDIQSVDDVEFLKLEGSLQGVEFFSYNGILYPIKKIGKDYMLIDQSRVLLNFLLQLNNILSLKRINPTINFADTYLKSIDRFHFVF